MKFLALLISTLLTISCFAKPLRQITLTPNNVVMLNEDISYSSYREFLIEAAFIRSFLPMNQTVYVVIYSPGGLTRLGYGISDAISELPNTQTLCAFCASAAGQIFIGSGVPALATKGSRMMMHEMKWLQSLEQLKAQAGDLAQEEKANDEFNRIHYNRMGMTKENYEAKIRDNDWYVEGQDLVKLKLADELVEVKCDAAMKRMYPLNCQTLEGIKN
jgi:ATP-dependent protease ClpP protease subunit